jgi:hypothetical protein
MSTPTPGQQLLKLYTDYTEGNIDLPFVTIDIGDCAHFDTEPIAIQVPLPPVTTALHMDLAVDETYNLPYIVSVEQDSTFGQAFPPHFHRNLYILAIDDHEPVMFSLSSPPSKVQTPWYPSRCGFSKGISTSALTLKSRT